MSYHMMQKSSHHTRRSASTSDETSCRWTSCNSQQQQQQQRRYHYNSPHCYPRKSKPCPVVEDTPSDGGYLSNNHKPMTYVFKGRSSVRRRGGGHQEQDCIDPRPYPISSCDNESCASTVISAITLPEGLASVPEAEASQKFCSKSGGRKGGDSDGDARPRLPSRRRSFVTAAGA